MPTTAEPGEDQLSRICRFIPEPTSHERHRSGSRREEILDYVAEAVRSAPATPLLEVTVPVGDRPRTLLLKLDGRSRWGSIKARTALALLASVAGRIGPDSTVVESTSGNLGVALAGICRELGIAFTAVVDSRLAPAMLERITANGARVLSADGDCPPDDSRHLQRRIALVQRILAENPAAVWTNQYENPANVAVHRWWTGHELDRQMDGGVQAVFAPVSTGGTFVGIRACLEAARPELECVAVDVDGSTIFGGPPKGRLLTGIGASKPSTFLESAGRPRHVMVSDAEAITACRALAEDLGVRVGGSSGATIAGALRVLHRRPDLTRVACICPDLGANYEQTLYDDAWLLERGVTEIDGRPVIGGCKAVFTGQRPDRRREGAPTGLAEYR
ncbi:MAG TPA: pyridoxal-phosphate dependent enzyme [Actinocrinis sp.]|nr:pyridoxal-phosphate dependent enzyme [Actinocrinis sp.]